MGSFSRREEALNFRKEIPVLLKKTRTNVHNRRWTFEGTVHPGALDT